MNKKTYLAQVYGPQSGYAYQAVETDLSFPHDSEQWETVLVDPEDFGEEIGVCVIDGSECYVWLKAQEVES